MDMAQIHGIASFIWNIADDVLRDLYVRGKYRDVILPMTVLRRLDAVLEDTKPAVLDMKTKLDAAGVTNQQAPLQKAAGHVFYNTSPFTLRDLRNRPTQQQLRADFEAYLNGFSDNVQDIRTNLQSRHKPCRQWIQHAQNKQAHAQRNTHDKQADEQIHKRPLFVRLFFA